MVHDHAILAAVLGLPALSALFGVYSTARGLAATSKLPAEVEGRAEWPRLSIIVPACNEAATLEEATRAKLASDYPNLELVLVDDRSTDGTTEIVDALSASDARVRAVHVRELPDGWLGKVHAQHRGVEAATGDWLLFSDADVHIGPSTLRRVIDAAEAEALDFVVMTVRLLSSGLGLDVMMAAFMRVLVVGGRLWKVRDPRSRVAVGGGPFNLVRRAALERSPGFEWLRLEIADDVSFGQMMKRSGARCAVFDGAGDVSLHFYRSLGEAMRGIEKNGYAVMGRLRPARMLATASLVAYLELGPLAGFALGTWQAAAASALVLGVVAAIQVAIARAGKRGLASALVPCVGPLLLLVFMLRSAVLAHVRGAVVWRGTRYPLAELREAQRLELF